MNVPGRLQRPCRRDPIAARVIFGHYQAAGDSFLTFLCCFAPRIAMVQTTEARRRNHVCARCRLWLDWPLVGGILFEGVMNSVPMVQLSNITPILGISVKSAIPGTHGTAGQCGCTPLW
jgi:hypothetical protein